MRVNVDRLRGAIAFLRSAFYNDGAEGESVHRVCSDAESLLKERDAAEERVCLLLAVFDALPKCSCGATATNDARGVGDPELRCDGCRHQRDRVDLPYAAALRSLLAPR